MTFGALRAWWSPVLRGAARPVLCIGHSHVACVARAAEAAGQPLEALNFWRMAGAIQWESGAPRFTSAIERRLREYDGPVFSLIGGAAPVVLGLAVHPRRFDFVLPTEPALPVDQTAELIPSPAMQRVLESHMAESLAVMALVRGLSTGRMFHLEPPPPSAGTERMQADIPWALYPGRCREVSPAPLRYKLWRLHSQILTRWCDDAGVEMVPVPAGTMDADGCLRDRYYGDGAHCNEQYGALVLAQMRQLA